MCQPRWGIKSLVFERGSKTFYQTTEEANLDKVALSKFVVKLQPLISSTEMWEVVEQFWVVRLSNEMYRKKKAEDTAHLSRLKPKVYTWDHCTGLLNAIAVQS